jgi:hypothetical protein
MGEQPQGKKDDSIVNEIITSAVNATADPRMQDAIQAAKEHRPPQPEFVHPPQLVNHAAYPDWAKKLSEAFNELVLGPVHSQIAMNVSRSIELNDGLPVSMKTPNIVAFMYGLEPPMWLSSRAIMNVCQHVTIVSSFGKNVNDEVQANTMKWLQQSQLDLNNKFSADCSAIVDTAAKQGWAPELLSKLTMLNQSHERDLVDVNISAMITMLNQISPVPKRKARRHCEIPAITEFVMQAVIDSIPDDVDTAMRYAIAIGKKSIETVNLAFALLDENYNGVEPILQAMGNPPIPDDEAERHRIPSYKQLVAYAYLLSKDSKIEPRASIPDQIRKLPQEWIPKEPVPALVELNLHKDDVNYACHLFHLIQKQVKDGSH